MIFLLENFFPMIKIIKSYPFEINTVRGREMLQDHIRRSIRLEGFVTDRVRLYQA